MTSHHYVLETIDSDDAAEMREWAEDVCRGRSIATLAADLGVAPSLDAIVARLDRQLFPAVKKAVADGCQKQLSGASR